MFSGLEASVRIGLLRLRDKGSMEEIVHGCSASALLPNSLMYMKVNNGNLSPLEYVLPLAHPLEESSEQYVLV